MSNYKYTRCMWRKIKLHKVSH